MEFIHLIISANERYTYKAASNIAMNILGDFFTTDVWCFGGQSFKDWALANKEDLASQFTYHIGANATFLEEEDDGYIYLHDANEWDTEKRKSQYLKISRHQFVQLIDAWQEKVCKAKPKEVIIKHENDQFIIETKD